MIGPAALNYSTLLRTLQWLKGNDRSFLFLLALDTLITTDWLKEMDVCTVMFPTNNQMTL